MNESTSKIAGELLQLEMRYQQAGLASAEEEQWDGLVRALIQRLRSPSEKRHNLRLPGQGAEVVIQGGKHSATCKVEDLSHRGLCLRGDLSQHFRRGEPVRLRSVILAGQAHPLDLRCQVVWKRNRWRAGLALIDYGVPSRRRYFHQAYYPLYLRYLKELTAS